MRWSGAVAAALACVFAGCASSYSWRPAQPAGMRSVAVPTFRCEADLTEFGSVMARQVLREFQREGTFRVASADEAALEVQGAVLRVDTGRAAYDRRAHARVNAFDFSAEVEVSVVDRRHGRVLVDNRQYHVQVTLTSGRDMNTARRDAAGRLADELARQVVDDVLQLNLEGETE